MLTTRLTPGSFVAKDEHPNWTSFLESEGKSQSGKVPNVRIRLFPSFISFYYFQNSVQPTKQAIQTRIYTTMSQQSPRNSMTLDDSISRLGQQCQIENQGMGAVGDSAADIEIYMGEQSNTMEPGHASNSVMGGGRSNATPPSPTKPEQSK